MDTFFGAAPSDPAPAVISAGAVAFTTPTVFRVIAGLALREFRNRLDARPMSEIEKRTLDLFRKKQELQKSLAEQLGRARGAPGQDTFSTPDGGAGALSSSSAGADPR